MLDTLDIKNFPVLIATSSSKMKDLVIKDGQLIFVQNLQRIAMDFNGKRVFYNQITTLDNDSDRFNMEDIISGYYFVIDTAVMWYHDGNKWIQITERPQEVVHIGVELPELGQAKEGVLYVNKTEKEISVWDKELEQYEAIADYTQVIPYEAINNLFN